VTKALWSLEAVLKERDGATIQKNAVIAYQALTSMEKLAEELITTSEIDQGTVVPKITKIKIVDVLDKVLREAKEKSEAWKVAMKIEPISAIAAMNTDPKLFSRVLGEVLENAIFYSPEGGVIEVRVEATNGDMLFEVSDNGIGIPEKQQTLVFTKFFRATNVDTNEIPGMGLGLFIAREYVKLLNGKIWFQSTEKEGTTFSILLPQK
jgi:signal transduction histidine kinase